MLALQVSAGSAHCNVAMSLGYVVSAPLTPTAVRAAMSQSLKGIGTFVTARLM